MQYTVINKYDLDKLIDEIKIYIKKGWKLQGGICTAVNNHNMSLFETTYCQAMVIDEEKQ